jgi:hypothetical protein
MPALALLVVVGLALVALLFVADATLEPGSPAIVTSQRSGLPAARHPDEIHLTTAPAPAPDMTSQAVLAAQPKSATPEAPAKIESAAREARAEAPAKKTGVGGSAKKTGVGGSAKKARAEVPPQNKVVTEPVYHQQNQFDRFSIKGY